MNFSSELIEFAPLIIILIMAGGLAGILAGLLGVGGGIVLVPAYFGIFSYLKYDSEQLMQICVATSLSTIVVTSLRSLKSHHAKGAVSWSILKQWAPGLAIGAVAGVFVAKSIDSRMLTGIFAVLALCVSAYMTLSQSHWKLRDKMPGLLGRSLLSPVVGGLSTLMGIGGGSFAVPIMTLCAVPIHKAVATAAGFGVILAVPSVVTFLLGATPIGAPPLTLGYVNLPSFAITIVMTLTTAPIGASIAHRTNAQPLKKVFAVFLFLVALNMLYKLAQ